MVGQLAYMAHMPTAPEGANGSQAFGERCAFSNLITKHARPYSALSKRAGKENWRAEEESIWNSPGDSNRL